MIQVIVGGMFSGKTSELIKRARRAKLAKQKVQVFKHATDTRYSDCRAVTHLGDGINACLVGGSKDLLAAVAPDSEVIFVDEIQFFDDGILKVVNEIANRGITVVLAGLDMDFQGNPFGPVPALMAIAERVDKEHAVCTQCGAEASYSYRLGQSHDLTSLGGPEAYEARCRKCFASESARDNLQ